MTSSENFLIGHPEDRSQPLLTCDSVDVVLIDRKTLKEINWTLIQAVDGFEECELWQEFVYTAQRYLEKSTQTQYHQIEELEHPIKALCCFLSYGQINFLACWVFRFEQYLRLRKF
jgi:hypothetical protein